MAEVVQVSRLLDQRGLSSFHYNLIFWCVLLSLIDGYDIAAIAFAAPHLVREWGLKPGALGPVFSASLIGILFGSAAFGWIGDRYGRKTALIASNLLFGVFTLAAAWSTSLDQLFWLRLLAGLGIGGVIPNVVAINTESAPRKLRATLALIGVGFVPLGGAIPGVVATTLVPTHGWQILFTIGGIVPIILALVGLFTLPESIKFMALHESQRAKMEKTIAALDPSFKVPANAKFVIEDEQQFPGFNPAYLFRQGLWLVTPLLWLLFALNLMGYFFLLSWTPTLMAVLKLPPSDRRVDRLCRSEFDNGARDRDLLRRLLRARYPDRHQCRWRIGLSDLVARQRIGLAIGHWPDRLNRWSPGRRLVDRAASREALYVVGTPVCRRRGGLLCDLEAQRGALAGASRTKGRAGTGLRSHGSFRRAHIHAAPG